MLKWIIRSSLQLRFVVAAVAILLIIFGVTQLNRMPANILPEYSRPYVEVQTEALGLSAEEVEALITTPLEADMLNGVSWVEEIRSESIPGLSSIVLIFESGTDIMAARQMVQERLVSVFALPNVSKPPTMLNPISSSNRCMMIGLTSEELSRIEVSVLARWTMLPKLMGVPGVANVSIWGFRDRQLQVHVTPKKLEEKGLTLKQIISTTGNALWVSPLSFLNASTPGTGGFFDTPNQRLGIRHLLPITTAEELSRVVVDGTSVPLQEVSDVVEDHQPLIGDAIIEEIPGLILVVEKFPWANTIDVTAEVDKAIEDLRPAFGGVTINASLFRSANFIESSITNLYETLMISGILVLIALIAFFVNWRTTLISVLTIILSIIVALGILYIQGTTFNMMILAGLIIALAILIDDAVVDIDHIKNKVKQSKEKNETKSTAAIIFEAIVEMRTPIVYATLMIFLTILPIFFLEGVIGTFFQSIASSYLLAILVSFFVAIFLTPALSLLLFKDSPAIANESTITKWLHKLYDKVVSRTLRVSGSLVLVTCLIISLFVTISFYLQPKDSLPEFKETELIVHWETPPGTSQLAMNRILKIVSREVEEIKGVNAVSVLIGRAVMSDMITNVNTGQLCISLHPEADYDKSFAEIQNTILEYPGFAKELLTFSQSKVRNELSGTDESFIVRIYGVDWNVMKGKAEEIKKSISNVEGIVDAQINYPDIEPTIKIEVDIDAANFYGLKPGDVRRQTTSLVSGLGVGNLFEDQKVFDVIVWGKHDIRTNISDIQNLLIETSFGKRVPLKDIADIKVVPGVTNIQHESVARFIDISAFINGRSFQSTFSDVNNIIKNINFPLEYRAELFGLQAERIEAQNHIVSLTIAALILIFLLLQAFLKSWKLATAIFFTLPLAFSGGVIANIIVSGNLLSMGTIIGFVTIFGITVRNSISSIHKYRATDHNGKNTLNSQLIEINTRERFAPVIITSFTILLAFIPILIVGNIAGLEIVNTAAVVLFGGMFTSVIYTLVALPSIYLMFGESKEPELNLGTINPLTEI